MTAVARVRAAYARIAEADRPEVWISLRDETEVLAEAAEIERRAAAGEQLPLAGQIVAVKDNIDVGGMLTTAGSRAYAYLPERDAPAVARLRAAGAIVVGKTNLDQFATGLVGTRSPFGAVRNAWSPERVSGGSSSGSAVAVALGMVDIGLATDTAGSGRVPAALNGIVGIKPTMGLIPTTGVVPACRTLDCVTVFARDIGAARAAVETMTGPDGVDPRARIDVPAPPLNARPIIAVPTAPHLRDLADGWAEAFAAVISRLKASGISVVEVDISPLLEAASLLYGGAFVAERASAVGEFIAANSDLVGRDLDPTVADIIASGTGVTATDYFRDLEKLERLGLEGRRRLGDAVALLTPTTTCHPRIAEVIADPIASNSRMGRYTNFANLLDMSAVALPAGLVDGLPFGVMLTGAPFADRTLAQLAERIVAPEVDLVVVGAHLRGQPLNSELIAAGGSYLEDVRTDMKYRLYALTTTPPKPGLVRTDSGGTSIAGEAWRLPAAGFARLVSAMPQPMAVGPVVLDDGRILTGFLCEPAAIDSAVDITSYGSWRAFRKAAASGVAPSLA